MKILWINTVHEKNCSGQTHLFGLSESLAKMGHHVTVILASDQKKGRASYIEYVRNPFQRQLWYKVKLALCLPLWVISKKPDYIMFQWHSAFVAALVLVLVKLRLYKNNLIHDIRTIPVPPYHQHSQKIFDMCVKISKKHFVGITTITEALKDKICGDYKISPKKVGVWSSGVDVELFCPTDGSAKKKALGLEGKFLVFYHGSVGHRRGVVELVEAVAKLKKISEDIHLFILGSGPEMSRISSIKEAKKLANVHVHEPVEYVEVPSYIAMSDVCVVPLPDEEAWRVSSPLKLMEYLAMGKPIILTDITAHKEIIKNRDDAFFIRDIRPETLAAAIKHAYDRRDEIHKMGAAGTRNVTQNLSWDAQAKKLAQYLESIQQE